MKTLYTPTYNAWRHMHARCVNPSHERYSQYGGRGIKVCNRWSSFWFFLSDMGHRPVGTSIDRKDNDGNYEPSNCRWTTSKQQANNRSTNHKLTANNQTKTIAEWSDVTGIKPRTIWMRISRGWTHERAVSTPARRRSTT